MSLEKDETLNTEGKEKGDAGTETQKTFTQEDINRIIAKESKKWEKEQSETLTKAKEFDKLQEKLKQQQEAELTEIQKLQKERDELLPLKEKATALEQYVKSQYEELASELSDEEKEKIETLSIPYTEKLSLAKLLLSKQGAPQIQNGAARASANATASPDKLTALAESQMAKIWPKEVKGSDSYKVKLERIKAELALLQTQGK